MFERKEIKIVIKFIILLWIEINIFLTNSRFANPPQSSYWLENLGGSIFAWLFGRLFGCPAGDSYDVTLAFEDAQVIQTFSREETDNTDHTDDTDDTYDTDAMDDTDVTDDTNDTDDTDDTESTENRESIITK